ncbi:unnamed protein product [Paramecium sonneborni]|uniref:Uncharacterized protein n=1 Tax=Paramecium sonneborni TaxID=65129 RepID=A0A8S1P4X0_9CILI|nr:unnamed protein product [Paramecium sonneborni]
MGASICQQFGAINDHEMVKEQQDLQPQNFDYKTNQIQIKIQKAAKICLILPDDPASLSKDLSSNEDRPEAQTPYLPYSDQYNSKGELQYIQLLGKDFTESVKIQSQLVSSQNEDILQQFQQKQSKQSDPRFCNGENRHQILNLQIVEDNLDDYINYDWKKSKFQLISINDQNLFKKTNITKPTKKQIRKQL